MKRITIAIMREIEKELSTPPFLGLPLGATLNDTLIVNFFNGDGFWRMKTRLMDQALMLRHWLLPRHINHTSALPSPGRILVAWMDASQRFADLLMPILNELTADPCVVICGNPGVATLVPDGVPAISKDQMWSYSIRQWRREYRRCHTAWSATLKSLCKRHGLPLGSHRRLAFTLMIASQNVMGSVELLRRLKPSVIVTDFDRNRHWSCLVLAARLLGIPSVTLVHGTMIDSAMGYSPVLADRIICWGDLDREKLIAVGEPPEKVVTGGCPRLSRRFAAEDFTEGRRKLSLDSSEPVIMLATAPARERLELAEMFCAAIEALPALKGVVRLHPSEKLAKYHTVIDRYPRVRFVEAREASLDEMLAIADVVVVQSSGVGSDALVKKRPVVILGVTENLVTHGDDLVTFAGCPHARTPGELAEILHHIVTDETYRSGLVESAEQFVVEFCSAFAEDSARIIADIVRKCKASSEHSL